MCSTDSVDDCSSNGNDALANRENIRRARVWLSQCAEPGSTALHEFVSQHGPLAAVTQIRHDELAHVQGITAPQLSLEDVDRDLVAAAKLGIRFIIPEDDEWPTGQLQAMHIATSREVPDLAPPMGLWLRGALRLDKALAKSVAIIGARAATDYGEHVAVELGYSLARSGWTVVSGGAYGIDAAAHRGALAADGQTVAVLAGGLDKPYPAGNAAMLNQIADNGLLVSEWAPGNRALRHRFLIRNRLIAAFTAGTVVVEAATRSGAASTARRTRQLGRALMAVPGPATSAMSAGAHHLIRECDARLVVDASQIIEEIGALGSDLAPYPGGHLQVAEQLDDTSRHVLTALAGSRGMPIEQLAAAANIDISQLRRTLPVMEVLDLVEHTPQGWRVAPAVRQRWRVEARARVHTSTTEDRC